MTTLKGKLEFHSLFQPIKLFTPDDLEIDLWIFYQQLFDMLNDKKTSMIYDMNSIIIKGDENSEDNLKFKSENDTLLIILSKIDGFGMSNISSYLPDMLQRLNGMNVIVTIDDRYIKIEKDSTEEVYGLYYTDGNSCSVPDEDVKSICKIGEQDCCIFCSVTGSGFECQKFNTSTARMILDRHSKGTMNATRIGNCEILGRKDL
jgi:hypothetical protein